MLLTGWRRWNPGRASNYIFYNTDKFFRRQAGYIINNYFWNTWELAHDLVFQPTVGNNNVSAEVGQ
jgi:hypothetical protein